MLKMGTSLQMALGLVLLSCSMATAMAFEPPPESPNANDAIRAAQGVNSVATAQGTSVECPDQVAPSSARVACDRVQDILSRYGNSKTSLSSDLLTGDESYWTRNSTGSRPVAFCADPMIPTVSYCVVTAKRTAGKGDYIALMRTRSPSPFDARNIQVEAGPFLAGIQSTRLRSQRK